METIKEIKIGKVIKSKSNGLGRVSKKTKRSITVDFDNGNVIKNTYKSEDAYFYVSQF